MASPTYKLNTEAKGTRVIPRSERVRSRLYESLISAVIRKCAFRSWSYEPSGQVPTSPHRGSHLDDLVLLLGRLIEVLVHLVEQPQEELLSVMLQIAAILAAVLVDDALEGGAHLRVILATPDRLEEQRELLRDLATRAILLRVELVAAG